MCHLGTGLTAYNLIFWNVFSHISMPGLHMPTTEAVHAHWLPVHAGSFCIFLVHPQG